MGGPGTPVSMTFLGRLYDHTRLLAFAKLYQEKTGFHKQHPALDEPDRMPSPHTGASEQLRNLSVALARYYRRITCILLHSDGCKQAQQVGHRVEAFF